MQPMNGMPQAPQGPKAGQDSFFKKKWVWAVGAVLVIVAFAAGPPASQVKPLLRLVPRRRSLLWRRLRS